MQKVAGIYKCKVLTGYLHHYELYWCLTLNGGGGGGGGGGREAGWMAAM